MSVSPGRHARVIGQIAIQGMRASVTLGHAATHTLGAHRAGFVEPGLVLDAHHRDCRLRLLAVTGRLEGTGQTDGLLARVNALRTEPGNDDRFFVVDLKSALHPRQAHPGRGRPIWISTAAASAKVCSSGCRSTSATRMASTRFASIPATGAMASSIPVHTEDPAVDAPAVPDPSSAPGLRLAGYETTPPIATPGPTQRESVLIEWTDTHLTNSTFEGSARELMRVKFNTRIHLMGDLSFNPRARRGDADWRVMYRKRRWRFRRVAATADSPQPTASRHAGRKNPAHHPRPGGTRHDEHRERQRPLSDTARQPVHFDRGRAKEVWALGFRNPHLPVMGNEQTNPRLIANLDWSPTNWKPSTSCIRAPTTVLPPRGQRSARCRQRHQRPARGG